MSFLARLGACKFSSDPSTALTCLAPVFLPPSPQTTHQFAGLCSCISSLCRKQIATKYIYTEGKGERPPQWDGEDGDREHRAEALMLGMGGKLGSEDELQSVASTSLEDL